MKRLFCLILFLFMKVSLFAQANRVEISTRVFPFSDTNIVYIGITNRFRFDAEKVKIIRIDSRSNGIKGKLFDGYFEISPKHTGVFNVTIETAEKKYNVVFTAKRVPPPTE